MYAALVRASAAQPSRLNALSCGSGLSPTIVCDHTLGVALIPPARWTAVPSDTFPTGTPAFWTLTPGAQEPPLHLYTLLSVRSARPRRVVTRKPSQPPWAVTGRGPDNAQFVARIPRPVAGAPAVAVYGLSGAPDFGQEIVVAHDGLVHVSDAFDHAYLALPGSTGCHHRTGAAILCRGADCWPPTAHVVPSRCRAH